MRREFPRLDLVLGWLAVGQVDCDRANQFLLFVVQIEDPATRQFGWRVFGTIPLPALSEPVDKPFRDRNVDRRVFKVRAVRLPDVHHFHERAAVPLLGSTDRNDGHARNISFEFMS